MLKKMSSSVAGAALRVRLHLAASMPEPGAGTADCHSTPAMLGWLLLPSLLVQR
jgi:hypothetical protein